MKTDSPLENRLRHFPISTDPRADEIVLERLLQAQREARAANRATHTPTAFSWLRSATAALASVAVLVALAFFLMDRTAPRAWAIEEAIAALQSHRAVRIVAATPAGIIELWLRANSASTHSSDAVVRAPRGVVTWTRKGRTYHYDPGSHTVYTEPAVTTGFVPWLSPELLGTLAHAPGAQIVHGRENLIGRKTVTLIGSLTDVTGPQSWKITFDAETKLPISIQSWRNLDRHGPPAFDARQITFLDELPAELFAMEIPLGARVVERPLTIPEENIGLLADPADGLPTDGLEPAAAARRILDELASAIAARDAARFRQLVPLTRLWNDELLHAMLLSPANDHSRIVASVETGPIDQTGRTAIGPIVAVPWTTRRADGTKVRDRMIIQFREHGPRPSCVIFGPHGLPVDVD